MFIFTQFGLLNTDFDYVFVLDQNICNLLIKIYFSLSTYMFFMNVYTIKHKYQNKY